MQTLSEESLKELLTPGDSVHVEVVGAPHLNKDGVYVGFVPSTMTDLHFAIKIHCVVYHFAASEVEPLGGS